MSKNKKIIKQIVGLSFLAAIMIVLQLVASYLPKLPGGLTLNLTLVPLVIGSILYSYKGGIFLGLVNAVIILIDPTTTVFYTANLFGTVLIVLLKSITAGIVSAFMFKLLYKKHFTLAVIISSIICPFVNTFIFVLGASIFFTEVYQGGLIVILGATYINFLFELGLNILLSSTIMFVIKIGKEKFDIGSEI